MKSSKDYPKLKTTKKNTKEREPGWYNSKPAKIAWKTGKILFRVLLTIALICLITGCIVGSALAVYVSTSVDVSADVPELTTSSTASTSMMKIYNKQTGNWDDFMHLEGANHIWVNLEDIPVQLQEAVIAIEDERFKSHDGVDWKRTFSAFANLIFKFSSVEYGGSTLTQQLVKQLTGNDDHSIMRKVSEMLEALELEKRYSKDEILESYLNVLPLTGNIIGVGYGAQYYFGCDVQDLTLAQCAVLASITQNPSYYSPYSHPENLRDRQQTVLSKMLKLGFINEDEYNQAINEELLYHSSIEAHTAQDWYTDMVIESVIQDLMEQYGYGYTQAESMVYYGGLTIYSLEDLEVQHAMEKLYQNEDLYPAHWEGDEEDPRFAFFATDYNGKVLCTIGDRGVKAGDRVTNISTMSKRQPGSSIKPVALYDLGIEYNLFHYSSKIKDAPSVTSGGRPWPPNYGYTTAFDNGDTLLYLGLQKSLNTVAVRVLKDVTLERSYDYLTNTLGISTFTPEGDMNYSALGLGGCYEGVYLSELTSAYQIFGNGGVYNGFYCYDRVEGRDGSIILQSAPKNVQAISSDSATVMNKLLQQVVKGGSGTLYRISGSWSGREIFAKTGTTDANNDVLAIGGTPAFVGGAWFGYRYNEAMSYNQAQAVKELWNYGMLELTKYYNNGSSFDSWGATKNLAFCRKSGKLATKACKDTSTGTYRLSNIPGACDECDGSNKKSTTGTGGSNVTTVQSGLTTKPNSSGKTTVSPQETVSTTVATIPTTAATTAPPDESSEDTPNPDSSAPEENNEHHRFQP